MERSECTLRVLETNRLAKFVGVLNDQTVVVRLHGDGDIFLNLYLPDELEDRITAGNLHG